MISRIILVSILILIWFILFLVVYSSINNNRYTCANPKFKNEYCDKFTKTEIKNLGYINGKLIGQYNFFDQKISCVMFKYSGNDNIFNGYYKNYNECYTEEGKNEYINELFSEMKYHHNI